VKIVQAAHLISLASVDSSLPSEFLLFKIGENKTSKGTFKLDLAGLESIVKAYQDHGVDLAIDYEHQTFGAASNGKPAPAAGWFKPEARGDGLWATNVRWTEAAATMLRSKEYRYFSPTFEVDKSNRITRLLPLALTNFPASKDQQALVAAKADASPTQLEVRPMNISGIIGLKEDAPEGEIEGRVVALTNLEKQVLEFTGKATVAEAMSLVIAAKDNAVKLAAAEKALSEWEERDAQARAKEEGDAIAAAIDGAVSSGRISLKDTDGLQKLRLFGETYKINALREHIAMLPPRPVRAYQAPAPAGDPEVQKLRDYEAYKAANPGVDPLVAANAVSLRTAGGR